MAQDIDQLCIDTIRTLSIDAIQKADSGHPGTPMAMAPVAYTLWQRFLRFDPADPIWPNRDRFVLSAGHASMLLYALLHLTDVQAVEPDYEVVGRPAVCLADIESFRQLDSRAPGIPSTAGPPGSRRPPARSGRGSRPRSGWRSPPSGRAPATAPISSTSTSTRSPATAA
jgi:transketolase